MDRNLKRGFTLTEILIAITLIAIIGTFIVRMIYEGYVMSSRVSKTVQLIAALKKAIDNYYDDTGYYPADTRQLWDNVLGTTNWKGPYVLPPFNDKTLNEFPKMPYEGKAYLECSDGNYLRLSMEAPKNFCIELDKEIDNGDLTSGRVKWENNRCNFYYLSGDFVACG